MLGELRRGKREGYPDDDGGRAKIREVDCDASAISTPMWATSVSGHHTKLKWVRLGNFSATSWMRSGFTLVMVTVKRSMEAGTVEVKETKSRGVLQPHLWVFFWLQYQG